MFVLDEWISHGETRGRSPNTLHGYRAKVARIKTSPLGNKQVSKLTARVSTSGTAHCSMRGCQRPPWLTITASFVLR